MVFKPLSSNLAAVWDIVSLVISFVCVFVVVQINSMIQKKNLLPTTVTRKVVHIFVAPVFMLTWPLYSGEWFSRYFAAVVPLLFVAPFAAIGKGIVKNEAFVVSMSRSGDASELLKGTLYYAILVLVVTLLWLYVPSDGLSSATPIALVVMGCLAGGDGLADISLSDFGALSSAVGTKGDASGAMRGKLLALSDLTPELRDGLRISIISMMELGRLTKLLKSEAVDATAVHP